MSIAPNVPGLGLKQQADATQRQVAATVAQLLGYDFTQTNERTAPALILDQ